MTYHETNLKEKTLRRKRNTLRRHTLKEKNKSEALDG